MKYTKTKYPNIYTYETKKGKRYYVRRNFKLNGKKKEVSASGLKTLAEARHALAEIENKIANNEYDPKKNMTVNDYWEIYSENRIKTGRWAPDTIANKESIFRIHFAKRYGKVKLRDIERLEYERYISDLLQTLARSTVMQVSSVFEAMLSDAVVTGYLDRNPILKIYIGESVIPPKDKSFSLENFKVWDECARKILDTYNYTMVRLTYFGMRRSEVLGIKFSSLKLMNGRFRILLDESRTQERPDGNGMKTDGSERYAVVDEETTMLLQECIKITKEIAKRAGRILSQNDFIFLNDGHHFMSQLGEPAPYARIGGNFKRVSEHCGIHASPHKMRHFFSTQCQIAGVSIKHMAAALGHSTSYSPPRRAVIASEMSLLNS